MYIKKEFSVSKPLDGFKKPRGIKDKKESTGSIVEDKVTLGGSSEKGDSSRIFSSGKAKWTILVYSAGDNNLEPDHVKDVIEMEKVGSSPALNIVVQLDRGEKPSSISGGWKGARRYLLLKDNDDKNINSPVLEDLGQINMSKPENLTDFIKWGMKNFPADHYMLIMSDHGEGWEGAMQDYSHSGWMELPQIKKALVDAQRETGKKIDIIGFDACLMGEAEVAYELKDVGDYFVASEETEGAEGWPYQRILTPEVLEVLNSALIMKLNLSPRQLAGLVVRESAKNQEDLPTMSAVDLSKMDVLAKASKGFAKALIDTDTPSEVLKKLAIFSEAFGQSQFGSEYKDYYDFCKKIVESKDITDVKLKTEAKKVMQALDEVIVAVESSKKYPNAHGLSIHLPSYGFRPWPHYRKLDFPEDTGWDEAIEAIGGIRHDKKQV